ncbi:MAG: glycosyltransferase [Clostridia bacterium]|nr:glycosyltransferase [Clostridia bacterium]
MSRTLIYLSNAMFPGGMNNPFLQQEQPWLVSHYDHAYVVTYQGWDELTQDTETPHVFRRSALDTPMACLTAPFTKALWQELARLVKDGRFTPVNAAKLGAFVIRGHRMHRWVEQIIRTHPEDEITLYSFWFSYDAFAAALSKKKHPDAKFVARGHYFEIDLRRNALNPYLMKQFIARMTDGIYFIGGTVRDWFMSYMKGRVDENKVHVLALGSPGDAPETLPVPKRLTEGVLHVVSCSRAVPIKRLDIIVDALSQWEGMPVSWLHIGDGEELEHIRAYAEEKLDQKENVIFRLPGNMQPSQIQELYEEMPFDAFLNTSEGEGVPVSIMEAMRCGIPAIAADVGGVAELVADGCGWRFAFEEGADGVLRCLGELCAMDEEHTMQVRRCAQAQWEQGYRKESLLGRMLKEVQE